MSTYGTPQLQQASGMTQCKIPKYNPQRSSGYGSRKATKSRVTKPSAKTKSRKDLLTWSLDLIDSQRVTCSERDFLRFLLQSDRDDSNRDHDMSTHQNEPQISNTKVIPYSQGCPTVFAWDPAIPCMENTEQLNVQDTCPILGIAVPVDIETDSPSPSFAWRDHGFEVNTFDELDGRGQADSVQGAEDEHLESSVDAM